MTIRMKISSFFRLTGYLLVLGLSLTQSAIGQITPMEALDNFNFYWLGANTQQEYANPELQADGSIDIQDLTIIMNNSFGSGVSLIHMTELTFSPVDPNTVRVSLPPKVLVSNPKLSNENLYEINVTEGSMLLNVVNSNGTTALRAESLALEGDAGSLDLVLEDIDTLYSFDLMDLSRNVMNLSGQGTFNLGKMAASWQNYETSTGPLSIEFAVTEQGVILNSDFESIAVDIPNFSLIKASRLMFGLNHNPFPSNRQTETTMELELQEFISNDPFTQLLLLANPQLPNFGELSAELSLQTDPSFWNDAINQEIQGENIALESVIDLELFNLQIAILGGYYRENENNENIRLQVVVDNLEEFLLTMQSSGLIDANELTGYQRLMQLLQSEQNGQHIFDIEINEEEEFIINGVNMGTLS